MRNFKMRCSALGLLMTEPKTLKEGPLSVGAKTAIRNMAAQDILGIDFEISDKKLEKGNLVEGHSLAMFNRVFGRQAVKNTERRSDDYLTGECDTLDEAEVVDIKSAWSAATFPICPEDVAAAQRSLYEYQLRGYMRLYDKPRARIAYCLVDTPEQLLGIYEPLPLHIVGHIPKHHRVTTWTIERDMDIEARIIEKVQHARMYYAHVIAEFDRTHQPFSGAAPWSDEAAPATSAPAEIAAPAF